MSDEKFVWQADPDPAEWDLLVARSPQGNIFYERTFLDLSGAAYELFLIRQGLHVKAGVCITKGPTDRICALDDLIIHNGLLFSPDPQKKPVKQRFEQFELTEFAIEKLSSRYDTIELALSPMFEDMRPFSWHNYHNPNPASHFLVELRYTSYLNISGLAGAAAPEESLTFRAMETLRQRHVRVAAKKGGTARLGHSSKKLISFYHDLMQDQGDAPSITKLARIENLIDGLIIANQGAIYEVLNREGFVIYVVAYAWDTHRAYYLFGAGHPTAPEPWQGTFAHWEAFKHMAAHHHIKEVDLEGVNSPRRGWFKLGFGGDLRPYYQVSKRMVM